MAATDTLGTRLAYHLTETTAFTAITPGASLPAGWVEVNNVQDINCTPHQPEVFDDGDLADSSEVFVMQQKFGRATFRMKRNGSQAQTLIAMAMAGDKNAWVIVHDDGYTLWTGTAYLKCTNSQTPNDRSLRGRAMLEFEICPVTTFVSAASA